MRGVSGRLAGIAIGCTAAVVLPALSVAPAHPAAGTDPLRISEVSPDDAVDDWFELQNTGTAAVDLTGWRFAPGGGPATAFPAGSSVPAGGYLVVTTAPAGIGGHFVLPAGRGSLALLAPALTEPVDRVLWSPPSGASYARCTDGPATDVILAATAAPSPGAANPCSVPSATPTPGTGLPVTWQAPARRQLALPVGRPRTIRLALTGARPAGEFSATVRGTGRVRVRVRAGAVRVRIPAIDRPGRYRVALCYRGPEGTGRLVFRVQVQG